MHIHSLKRAALAACAVAAVAAAAAVPAPAAPATTKLRVEANGHDIGPGWSYVHDTVTYTSSKAAPCSGTGEQTTVEGPTALGLLVQASEYTAALRPVQISDRSQFGAFVCGIGDYTGSSTSYWLYKVDHVAPEVGADQFAIAPSHGEVLWYFVDGTTNSGNELALVTDRDVRAGDELRVRVLEYDLSGNATPAAGVRILGGAGAVTDPDGAATLVFDAPGRPVIRGVRGIDIPTDGVRLCVYADSRSECTRPVARIVGTAGADVLRGGSERELVVARLGRDTVRVRGGGVDTVRCGGGHDSVVADARDVVTPTCEEVSRR
jgi:hypothetical protein